MKIQSLGSGQKSEENFEEPRQKITVAIYENDNDWILFINVDFFTNICIFLYIIFFIYNAFFSINSSSLKALPPCVILPVPHALFYLTMVYKTAESVEMIYICGAVLYNVKEDIRKKWWDRYIREFVAKFDETASVCN